ncbi:MAG TPA: diguanylate cyclase [Gemmatimonadaceae bacterium]|nr:diguanylate cyclase [Gemmatimonadaceae bacterium]
MRRILVADDDVAMLSLLSWLLKEQGYQVATAAGGAELIRQLEKSAPDLLLLDIMMPEMDGVQVLRRMKDDERWRDVPVMMISALPPEDAAVRTLGLGAVDFIRKPFRVRELLARIEAQFRSREALRSVRVALEAKEEELRRAREEAENRRKMVDILHEVTGQLSADEIYRILTRRLARALNISRCSLILARPGDEVGIVATAHDDATIHDLEIRLERYPEISTALEQGVSVLIEDAHTNPLFEEIRQVWDAEGREVPLRSAIALPFTLDEHSSGVFFLRTTDNELPLTKDDVDFADTVIKAALAAIRRAQLVETTREDNVRLAALATTDPLTLVLNRRALVDRLTTEIDRARRYNSVVSLLMIDLDSFKPVNDTHGHLAGDDVLREVGAILQHEARAVDIVARYGGEEFVIALPETGQEGAVTFAERVRERIAGHTFRAGSIELRITASIGVAIFPAPFVETSDDLLARADEALYRAKADGRNRVHL